MCQFWIVEPERASTTACDKATSKTRTLDSRQNPPVFAQAHASLLPDPFSLLFLKYNTCALLRGRMGNDIRPPAQSYFILVWVTGWSGPSVKHLSDLQMGRRLHGTQWTCLGCSWRSPLHACSFFCHLLQLSASAPLLQFARAKPTSQSRSGAGHHQWLGCLSVTWYSREVVLPCLLCGMKWSSSRFLKTYAVSGLFLNVNQHDGKFCDQNRLSVKNYCLGNVEKWLYEEQIQKCKCTKFGVIETFVTEWLWFLQRPGGCDPGCDVQELLNFKGGQENKLIQGQSQSMRVAYSKGQEVKAVAGVQVGQIRNSWPSSNVGKKNKRRAEAGVELSGRNSISQTVKLCSKAYLHAQKGPWRDNGRVGKASNILPGIYCGMQEKSSSWSRRLILRCLGGEAKVGQERFR